MFWGVVIMVFTGCVVAVVAVAVVSAVVDSELSFCSLLPQETMNNIMATQGSRRENLDRFIDLILRIKKFKGWEISIAGGTRQINVGYIYMPRNFFTKGVESAVVCHSFVRNNAARKRS
jgi:hypothetical protein